MIIASHMVAGAAAGSLCPWARVAVPVAFVSHFVLDQIPHSCFNTLPAAAWTGLAGMMTRVGVLVDGIIVLLVFALAWRAPERWAVIVAAVAAFAPDPLTHISPINHWFTLIPGSFVVPWVHRTFHCDVTQTHMVLGFVTQVVVVSAGLYVLARKGAGMEKVRKVDVC